MHHLLTHLDNMGDPGLAWPTWLAAAGALLFCLLVAYAGLLLFAAARLPRAIRFMQPATLRGRLIMVLTLVATLPAISLALVLTERTSHESIDRATQLLAGQADGMMHNADYFIARHTNGLVALARAVEPYVEDRIEVANALRRFHTSYRSLGLLLAIDPTGQTLGATQRINDMPETFPGTQESLAERDFVRQPLETGRPYISAGTVDGALGDEATVAISVPIVALDGRARGVVTGTIALGDLRHAISRVTAADGLGVVVTDGARRVLVASESAGLKPLNDLRGSPMRLAQAAASNRGVFRVDLDSGAAPGGASFLAVSRTTQQGWQIFLFRSLAEIQAAVLREYGFALTWLALTLGLSICLALALARNISGPLQDLERAVRDFDLDLKQPLPDPATDAPRELLTIFDHLASMAGRLQKSYSRLQKAIRQGEKLRGELIYVIANREKEIEQRTEELQQANQTLQRLTRMDSLTGIANRRWFAEFLGQNWRSCMRDDKPLSLLIIDIDDFKAYNDSYGHQKGDCCLKLVAESIKRIVGRASDLVSRYGGEEFVVVLSDTPLDGALTVGENIRSAIESLAIPHRKAPKHGIVTVSVGVTSTVPERSTNPETFLVAADRAMHAAKHEGKNRIAYSTPAQTGLFQSLCVTGDMVSRPS
jgi:diguanylate cyclase (GGDEF)-like protein